MSLSPTCICTSLIMFWINVSAVSICANACRAKKRQNICSPQDTYSTHIQHVLHSNILPLL